MAGGPSTPALVAAVARAGGLGFLAGGYLDAATLTARLAEVREAGVRDVGVNLFVPERDAEGRPAPASAAELAAVRDYRATLARDFGADLPEPRADDDDHYSEKIEALASARVPLVSFTFGLPSARDADRLRASDATLVATVTSPEDARAALDSGTVDALWVQGAEAGGHRSTFRVADTPNGLGVQDLVRLVRAEVGAGVPLVASGGIADAALASAALRSGAEAVAAGTAFLGVEEAGTSAVHRQALLDDAFTETAVTRVFSGRPARGLRVAFMDRYADAAPPVYPQVNQVTGPLRKAAAAEGRAQDVHLWAGTQWRRSRGPATAAEAIAHVSPA